MKIKSALCAVVICLASSAALTQPAPLPAGPVAGLAPVMPPQQIANIVRARGFVAQATPMRNGEAYQVRAIDRFGRQVRLAIDARYGDILMVRPIAMLPTGIYGPRPYGPPPSYYDDDLPTGAVGAYPPPGRTALAPGHAPIPRPKPGAKPAAVTPAPAAAPEAKPSPATAAADEPAPTAPPASAPPASAAAAPSAMPPVAPLE